MPHEDFIVKLIPATVYGCALVVHIRFPQKPNHKNIFRYSRFKKVINPK